MKKVVSTLLIVFIFGSVLFGQSKTEFGINGGVSLPTGDISNFWELGVNIGATVHIPTSSEKTNAVIGASYYSLPGKSFMGYEINSADMVSLFAGPQFKFNDSFYLLPAISGNINEGEHRFGFDLGLGSYVPLGSGDVKLNFNAKFSFLNLIGRENGEKSTNVFRITAGLNF